MPVRSDDKDVNTLYIIVRAILLIVVIVFLVYGVIIKQPCNGIDDEFLKCRLTGTWGDWLGSIFFCFGAVWLSGIFKGLNGLVNGPKAGLWMFIFIAATILGPILFWNL